jgi:hypothetical protein
MENYISEIIVGVITTIIVGWLGLGKSKVVVIRGQKRNNKWKWLMIFSVLLGVLDIYLMINGRTILGLEPGILLLAAVVSYYGSKLLNWLFGS